MLPSRWTLTPSRVIGGLLADAVELVLEGDELAGIGFVLPDRLLVRVDDHDAAVAVDDDGVAAADDLRQILQRHDGRNAQGTGDDGGVAGPPAGVGGHAPDVVPVEAGRLRGAQLPRDDDDLFPQVEDVLPLGSEQVPQQTPLDVVDVRRTLADVRVLDAREMRGDLAQDGRDGVLGRHRFRVDHVGDLAPQAAVLQESHVHGEDVPDAAAAGLALPGLELGEFLNGVAKGVAGALDLHDPLRGLDLPPRDAIILGVDDQRFADRYSRRDSYSLFYLHDPIC